MTQGTYILEFIGIIAFAISGMIVARAKDMDLIGIYAVSCVTAFGGGTLRDLILDKTPVYWISHQEFPLIILIMALIYTYVKKIPPIQESHIIIPDALGLGVFTVLGAQLSIESGMSFFISSILGVMTGTFGGVLRDIICNEVPLVFRKINLYATCSFAGCWVYFLSSYLTDNSTLQLVAGFVFIVAIRLLAVKYNIKLQKNPN